MNFVHEKRAGFEGVRDEATGLQFGVQLANESWCPFVITSEDVSVTVPANQMVKLCVVVPNLSTPFEVTIRGPEVEELNYGAPHTLRLGQAEGEQVELTFTKKTTVNFTAYRLSAQQHDAPMDEGVFGGAPADFVHDSPTPALAFTLNIEVELPAASPLPTSGNGQTHQRPRRRAK